MKQKKICPYCKNNAIVEIESQSLDGIFWMLATLFSNTIWFTILFGMEVGS